MPPYISVIIPAYNYARYLPYAVKSALEQKNVEVEVIVVDDGSTDGTAEAAASFGGAIKYIYQENQGLSAARNTGIKAAQGEFINFLDADDILGPGVLHSQASALKNVPEAGISICRNQIVRSASSHPPLVPVCIWHLIKHNPVLQLCRRNIAPVHAYLAKREIIAGTGFFDTSLTACEDYDYWFRCAASGVKMIINPQGLVFYLHHPDSMSYSVPNQLKHDMIMAGRVRDFLFKQKTFLAGMREDAFMAHAVGTLKNAVPLFSVDSRAALEAVEIAGQSILEAAKMRAMYSKKAPGGPEDMRSPEDLDTLRFFVHETFMHLNMLASVKIPQMEKSWSIMRRLYPSWEVRRAVFDQVTAELEQKIFVPQNFLEAADILAGHKSIQEQPERKRVLLGSELFWPEKDENSLYMSVLGQWFSQAGYEVHHICRQAKERGNFIYNGVNIVPFRCQGILSDNYLGDEYHIYRAFLSHARYDAAFFISRPDSWLMAPLMEKSLPHIKCCLIPRIKAEYPGLWQTRRLSAAVYVILQNAAGLIRLSESGVDRAFMDSMELKSFFLPWVALPEAGFPGCGQTPEPADILIVRDKEEWVMPRIVRAMSKGVPWLASSAYGEIGDYAGGILCPKEKLDAAARVLRASPALGQALGSVGFEHWKERLSREAVFPALRELAEKNATERDLSMPSAIRAANSRLKEKIMALCV